LELLGQPANKILYTFKAETANKYKIPKFKLQSTIPSTNGITAHPIKLKIKAKEGANKKRLKLELFGKVVSFTNNFNPSARG